MGDVSKLPRWAQNRIEKLEADVAYWEGKVTEAQTGDTDTFLADWPENKGLPRGSRIEFKLTSGVISVEIKDDALRVHGRAGRPLVVQPEVTNVLRIKTAKEHW